MLASFLTTIFFSFSVIFASRSARVMGAQQANFARLALALLLLALWAHLVGQGIGGPAFGWFVVSGIIGFGLGDMALFGALPRIGPRLAILLTQCLAAPIAAATEWFWLGTELHLPDLLCAAAILAGVALALAPDRGREGERRVFWIGVLCGIGSACGQAFGAVVSRKANAVADLAGFPIDGGTAAYQRIIGGMLMTSLALIFFRRLRVGNDPAATGGWKRAWPLVLGNSLAGPVIGAGCYQWALKTTPSGIVLPIVAISPLVTMILAYFIDGSRPPQRAITGGVIAVAGAVMLNFV